MGTDRERGGGGFEENESSSSISSSSSPSGAEVISFPCSFKAGSTGSLDRSSSRSIVL